MDASCFYWILPSGEIVTLAGLYFRHLALSYNKPLNPNAQAWSPQIRVVPEEDRCLFMTFSNRHPLNEHEIYKFFTQIYGDILERVYVHWPVANEDSSGTETRKILTPQFGKIVFKSSWFPMVMTCSGKRQIKFVVNGKPVWCKKYDPEKAQACRKNNHETEDKKENETETETETEKENEEKKENETETETETEKENEEKKETETETETEKENEDKKENENENGASSSSA